MSKLGKRDVTDILELLEKELDAVPRLDKVQKMKWRSRIRHQENWFMALDDLKPEKVLMKLQGRLSEVFRLYPASFSGEAGRVAKKEGLALERKRRCEWPPNKQTVSQ
jgi:hypothetical protein